MSTDLRTELNDCDNVTGFAGDGNSPSLNVLTGQRYDGVAFSTIMGDLLAYVNGRWEEDPPGSGIIKIYNQDNVTLRYTLTKAPGDNERVRS